MLLAFSWTAAESRKRARVRIAVWVKMAILLRARKAGQLFMERVRMRRSAFIGSDSSDFSTPVADPFARAFTASINPSWCYRLATKMNSHENWFFTGETHDWRTPAETLECVTLRALPSVTLWSIANEMPRTFSSTKQKNSESWLSPVFVFFANPIGESSEAQLNQISAKLFIQPNFPATNQLATMNSPTGDRLGDNLFAIGFQKLRRNCCKNYKLPDCRESAAVSRSELTQNNENTSEKWGNQKNGNDWNDYVTKMPVQSMEFQCGASRINELKLSSVAVPHAIASSNQQTVWQLSRANNFKWLLISWIILRKKTASYQSIRDISEGIGQIGRFDTRHWYWTHIRRVDDPPDKNPPSIRTKQIKAKSQSVVR